MRRPSTARVRTVAGLLAALVSAKTAAAPPEGPAPGPVDDVAEDTAPGDGTTDTVDAAVDRAVEDAEKLDTPAAENDAAADDTPEAVEADDRPGPPAEESSAFAVPTARRLDPYGPRPEGVPKLTRAQINRFALDNPLVHKAQAEVEFMQAQLKKVRFAWVPIVETVTTLSPGLDTECDDIRLDDGTSEGFDFQYCRPGRDPDLDVQNVKGYFEQLGRAGVRFKFSANVIIPITGFGKLRHLKRAAKTGVAVRKLEKLAVKQETMLRVQQAFNTLLLARESIAILREAENIVRRAQERVEEDLGGGAEDWDADVEDIDVDRDPDDLFRVQLASIEVEDMMREALKVESLALSALWALAGDAAPQGFDIQAERLERDDIEDGLKSLTEYKAMALHERPEARMAAAAVRAREAQERLARAMFLPDLGIVIDLEIARSSTADPAMNQLYYQDRFNYSRAIAALALRWKWDFHNKAFDLQAARATRRAAEYQKEAAQLLLGRDVEEAYAALVEAQHAIGLQRRAVDLAWKLVISQEQKDTVGGGEASDLLKALETWYRRRFDYAEAIGAYNQALAGLSRAVGTSLRETRDEDH